MRRRPLLLIAALAPLAARARVVSHAVTDDGRRVELHDDGRWTWAEPASAPAAATRLALSALAARPAAYLDRAVAVRARARVETQYLDRYADAAASHLPFALQDVAAPYAVAIAYMARGPRADALRRRIPPEGAVEGEFTLRILRARWSPEASVLLAELVDYDL